MNLQSVRDLVLRLIFEKIPGLNLLNGYKEKLGELTKFAVGVTALLGQYFPNIPHLDLVNSVLVFFGGTVLSYIGQLHQAAKARG